MFVLRTEYLVKKEN